MKAAESRYLNSPVRHVNQSLPNASEDSRLGADFDLNAVGAPVCVENGLTSSLDVATHAVVVARAVAREALASEEGDGVFWCAEAAACSILGDRAGADVVRRLSAEEEAVVAEDRVSRESWALRKSVSKRTSIRRRVRFYALKEAPKG